MYAFQIPVSNKLSHQIGYLDRLNIFGAWQYTQGSSQIPIAQIGCGITATHLPELNTKPIVGWTFPANTAGYPTDSGTTFSTAVANNLIGSGSANGIWGICYNSPLIHIAITGNGDPTGTTDPTVLANAILKAAALGGKVIYVPVRLTTGNQALQDACASVWTGGGIIVASFGGGEGAPRYTTGPMYPASYPNVVAVGSVEATDAVLGVGSYPYQFFGSAVAASNYGPRIDIAGTPTLAQHAWGVLMGAIGSQTGAPNTLFYTNTPSDYNVHSYMGPMLAAVQIAGIVNLIWSAAPSLTNAQVVDCLYSTVDKSQAGWMFYNYFTKTYGNIGVGLADAEKAVLKAKSLDPANQNVVFPYLRIHGRPVNSEAFFSMSQNNVLGAKTIAYTDGTARVICEGLAGWQITGFCNGQEVTSVELWIDGQQIYWGPPTNPWTGLLNRVEYRNTCWDLRVIGHA
jgi:hypothetical protein